MAQDTAGAPRQGRRPRKARATSRRQWDLRGLTEVRAYAAVMAGPPSERIALWAKLGDANPDLCRSPGFAAGWIGVLPRIVVASTRVSQHLPLAVPVLESLRGSWHSTLTPSAAQLLEGLPEAITLWRVASSANRLGLCWCLDREYAVSYARCPAIRQRSPLLIEAVCDKANVVNLAESVRGWDVLALVSPGDVVSEVPL